MQSNIRSRCSNRPPSPGPEDSRRRAYPPPAPHNPSPDEGCIAAKAETEVIRQEKETAEASGLKVQEAYRSFVTGMLNDLRKIAGKSELKEEDLTNRAMESLQDSIKDVREEIVALRNIDFKEGSVPNPTLPPKDGGPTKTEQQHREVDLSEGIEKLFRSLV